MERTYIPWQKWPEKSKQKEYTESTPMFAKDGTLIAAGWARRNVFEYDRDLVKAKKRRKEWDFYQVSNGRLMCQISFANIQLGGYISAKLIDLVAGKTIAAPTSFFLGGGEKYILPPKGDVPNNVKMTIGKAEFEFDTRETSRTLYFRMPTIDGMCDTQFDMDIMPGLENITTVLPFDGLPDRYFMTTKQNCMPCSGYYKLGEKTWEWSKEDTFCTLDWGRVCTPYSMVWYWGNMSTYVEDAEGNKRLFGFEITWGIGNEKNATETCLFYDGKAHKIGAVDCVEFPKGRYMEPWHIVSEDGRFDMTMTPFFDNHGDTNALFMRMNAHQVHGLWNGFAILDDGTKIEIKDKYAFCEYVENRW